MSSNIDKQINLAVAGFLAPIIGLIISAVLSIFETIPNDQLGMYSFAIWGTILVLDILGLFHDLDSIRVNGPVYGICFLISFCLVNGISLRDAISAVLLVILIGCILGIAYIILRNRYY